MIAQSVNGLIQSNDGSMFDDIDDKYRVFTYYKTILQIPKINETFASIKHRRFLMHLIGHLSEDQSSGRMILTDGFFSEYVNPSALFKVMMRKYFQHSCNPNVLEVIRGGKCVLFAVKPIKPGEQLFISFKFKLKSTQQRQASLWESFKLKCACPRCDGITASTAQRQQLVADPAYRYFQSNQRYFKLINALNIEKGKTLMVNCVEILRKYGQMDWCDELGEIITFFYNFHYMCAPEDIDHPLVQTLLTKNSK